MRVFVTGATGFIGRALIPRLQRDGHAVVAWVRSPARARGLLGAEVELVHADTALGGLVAAIERCDAVVNLAGAVFSPDVHSEHSRQCQPPAGVRRQVLPAVTYSLGQSDRE